MKFTAKTAGRVGVISFLVISLIFMHGEWGNINCQADFNIPKWTSYFTCIGAMGTAITVIYLAFQLQEMVEARRSQIKPNLFVQNFTIEVEKVEVQNFFQKNYFAIYPKEYEKTKGRSAKIFQMTNRGLGLAREIKISWIYSVEEVKEIKPPEITVHNHNESDNLDFLNKDEIVDLYIPINYLACCAPSVNGSLFHMEEEEIKPKPSLKLCLNYKDLEGVEYNKSYIVNVEAADDNIYFKFKQIKSKN